MIEIELLNKMASNHRRIVEKMEMACLYAGMLDPESMEIDPDFLYKRRDVDGKEFGSNILQSRDYAIAQRECLDIAMMTSLANNEDFLKVRKYYIETLDKAIELSQRYIDNTLNHFPKKR